MRKLFLLSVIAAMTAYAAYTPPDAGIAAAGDFSQSEVNISTAGDWTIRDFTEAWNERCYATTYKTTSIGIVLHYDAPTNAASIGVVAR